MVASFRDSNILNNRKYKCFYNCSVYMLWLNLKMCDLRSLGTLVSFLNTKTFPRLGYSVRALSSTLYLYSDVIFFHANIAQCTPSLPLSQQKVSH